MKHLRKRHIVLVAKIVIFLMVFGVASSAAAAPLACGPFLDIPNTAWYCTNVLRLLNLNITSGTSATTYSPTNYVTRYQMAAFLDRLTKAYSDTNEPYIYSVDNMNNGATFSGKGIIAQSYDQNGLDGISYGAGFADNGIYGQTNSTDSLEAGVNGVSTGNAAGVTARNTSTNAATTTSYGLRAYSAHGHGIFSDGGVESNDYGGWFTGNNGVFAHAADGYAVYGETDSPNFAAAVFDAAGWNGVYAAGSTSGSGGGRGLWAESDSSYAVYGDTFVTGGYGVYTNDKIYAGGGCVGCTSMIIAVNGSNEALEPGDVVAVTGIDQSPTEFYARPVLTVQKADVATGQNVVGAVEGRYISELVTHKVPHVETQYVEVPDPEADRNGDSAHEPDRVPVSEVTYEEVVVEEARTTTEPVAPGELMTVVYRGIAQVKIDATTNPIKAGDLLGAHSGMLAKAAPLTLEGTASPVYQPGMIVGTALEDLPDGKGLIWVLVDLR
jgi:hypothetical protein